LRKAINLIIIISFAYWFSCDPKLFETEEDPLGPTVSEIFTSISNLQILVGDSAKFWVEASNPGEGSLHYDWDISSGEFLSSPDQDTIKWRAPFNGGRETIEVRVSNNDKTTVKTKDIDVISLGIPVVNIIFPKDDAYLVQYETIEMEAEAFHDNGISHVEFFVNDSSLGIIDGNTSNNYTVSWLNKTPAGDAEIKVTAVARSAGTVGSDKVFVNIEGVIPGKK
jgi:hypothetical protein